MNDRRWPIALILALLLAVTAHGSPPKFRVTGTFTNLRFNQESGDLLGTEILIFPAQGDRGGFVALVQIAEGSGPYAAIVPINVNADEVKFRLPPSGPYPHLSFCGIVERDRLVGAWSGGKKEILSRHPSYWDGRS